MGRIDDLMLWSELFLDEPEQVLLRFSMETEPRLIEKQQEVIAMALS